MSTNNHTAITVGAAANAGTINGPLGQLDAAIGNLATLPTTAQTIIGAIAEHEADIGTLATAVSSLEGDFSLNTYPIYVDPVNVRVGIGDNAAAPVATLQVRGSTALGGGLVSAGDYVNAGPLTLEPATAGTVNFGPTTGQTAIEWMCYGHVYRIRQTGTIKQTKMYTGALTGISGVYLKIWRENGSGFDLVGTSENLLGQMSATTVNTMTLSTGIAVEEGDYIGARVTYTSASVVNFYASAATVSNVGGSGQETAVHTYSVLNATPSATAYNWAGQTDNVDVVVLQEVLMAAPVMVMIGDSITSGSQGAQLAGNASFIDTLTSLTDLPATYPYMLGRALGYSYQNMGMSGEASTATAARFARDVVALKPKIVVIAIGINDVNTDVATATIVANVTAMLDAAVAASIAPVIVGVGPAAPNATLARWRAADTLNTALEALAATYEIPYVDLKSYIAKYYYLGTDANNLYILQEPYSVTPDGIHLSAAGYARMAEAVADAIDTMTVQAGAIFANATFQGDLRLDGNSPRRLTMGRAALNPSDGHDLVISAGGANPSSTNADGGNLVLAAGVATGTGTSAIEFQTANGGASGNVDEAPTTKVRIVGNGTSELTMAMTEDINNAAGLYIENSNAGTAAFGRVLFRNNSSNGSIDYYSTGFATNGAYAAASLHVSGAGSGGVNISATSASAAISLYAGGYEAGNKKVTINSAGVGINTAPVTNQALTVSAGSTAAIGLVVSVPASAANYAQVWKYDTTTSGVYWSTATADFLQIGVRRNYGDDLPGAAIYPSRNNNTGSTGYAAGCVGYDRAAGLMFTWVDNSGNLRIHTAQPTGVSGSETVSDTAGAAVGTQLSTLASKNILGDGVSPADALATILATPIKRFTYKSGAYCNSEFHGIIADYSPEFAMDAGRAFSPVSAFGYAVQAIKALTERIAALEA